MRASRDRSLELALTMYILYPRLQLVPFVIDKDENIVLKTAYPSRKFHKIFGRRHEDET